MAMQHKIRLKRLRQLEHMLNNHSKLFKTISFDIEVWNGDPRDFVLPKRCTSAACALGSACLYEPFKKLGLALVNDAPSYKKSSDFEAGAEFFGITRYESSFLFSPTQYHDCEAFDYIATEYGAQSASRVTPKMVAKRVRWLIERYKKKRAKKRRG